MNKNKHLTQSNITMYNVILEVMSVLGLRKFASKDQKNLRSYENQSVLFTKELKNKLLTAFTGNYHFNPDKQGKATQKIHFSEPSDFHDFHISLLGNEKDINNYLTETEITFDYFFERTEEVVFISQRLVDNYRLTADVSFERTDYLCIILAAVHNLIVNSKNRDYIVKSCPFLYLNHAINKIVANEYNVTKTIKITIKKYIDELRGDRPKNTISFYDTLNSLDEDKNTTRTIYSIFNDIKTLLIDLTKDPAKGYAETYTLNLSQKQKNLVYEMWGLYNSLFLISRLRFSPIINPHLKEQDFLKKVHKYIDFADSFYKSKVQQSGDYTLLMFYLSSKNIIWLGADRRYINFIENNYVYAYKLYAPVHSNKSQLVNTSLSKTVPLSDFLAEFFDKSNMALVLYNFEIFYRWEIQEIISVLNTMTTYEERQKIINALLYLQCKSSQKRQENLNSLRDILPSAPYFLKRFISILYIGIFLSKKFAFKKNALNPYISSYLETTWPSFELHPLISVELDTKVFCRFHNYKYDLNYGLIRMIKEYNLFIIHNQLDTKHLVNPLQNINAFLSDFLEKLISMSPNKDNYLSCCSKALKGLKPKLTNAEIPSISYSLYDLKSSFILTLTGLLNAGNDYEGTAAIQQFLNLPSSKQKIILEACHAVSPPKEANYQT